jgi:hypothetical protein
MEVDYWQFGASIMYAYRYKEVWQLETMPKFETSLFQDVTAVSSLRGSDKK